MRRLTLTLLALTACADPDNSGPLLVEEPEDELPPGECYEPAGKLTIYALPPPVPLDWSSPNNLLRTVQASRTAGAELVEQRAVAMAHSIGHVNLELECGDYSIPLTGQTNVSGDDWQAVTDGAGLLLRDTDGALDHMPDIGDREETIADIAMREKSGKLTKISFVVNQKMCARLKDFVDEYTRREAYKHYNGAFRARRMEGAGCAIWGAGVIDVGGLLRRSLFTPEWARSQMIGSARIADFLGDGKYTYGGNLVARDADGTHLWPENVDVPAPAGTPVWIFSPVLDAWSGPEDLPFPIAGLTGAMKSRLPFTIYDPQMMAEWAERVWTEASASGSAMSLGVPWTATTSEAAHEVTYDASCVRPQKLAYEDDNDDLFLDSDAP
ncbi:MAG: hypothetical protein H0V17_08250 [Deltaproteobacteria bacterium]|nr:hypothetical protein [Deltaproteobacteria bacterium]